MGQSGAVNFNRNTKLTSEEVESEEVDRGKTVTSIPETELHRLQLQKQSQQRRQDEDEHTDYLGRMGKWETPTNQERAETVVNLALEWFEVGIEY